MATKEKKVASSLNLVKMAKVAIQQSKIGSGDPIYLGVLVVQAPGAWSRVGPTWIVPGVGHLVFGPGLRTWGTSEGLAQLACDTKTQPQWHAIGVSTTDPDITFYMFDEVVEAHAPVKAVVDALREAMS